jgi:hypothetical protein
MDLFCTEQSYNLLQLYLANRVESTKKQICPATCDGGAWGERRNSSYSFLTSALDAVSGQRHDPAELCPGVRTSGTHCTRGLVDLRAGLDTEVRGKIRCSCRKSNPDRSVVQSVVRHYTDWATPAPVETIIFIKLFWSKLNMETSTRQLNQNPAKRTNTK